MKQGNSLSSFEGNECANYFVLLFLISGRGNKSSKCPKVTCLCGLVWFVVFYWAHDPFCTLLIFYYTFIVLF